jgi:hypothetical protein
MTTGASAHNNVAVVGVRDDGFSAPLAAADDGGSLCLPDKGDRDHARGNSCYTVEAGRFRSGLDELPTPLECDAGIKTTVSCPKLGRAAPRVMVESGYRNSSPSPRSPGIRSLRDPGGVRSRGRVPRQPRGLLRRWGTDPM